MVVLKKNESVCIFESKQVGDLYHVCNTEAIAKYIAPTDTLFASGKFQNYLKGGNNYISFTRNKRFIVSVESTQQFVLFRFVVDGDSHSPFYHLLFSTFFKSLLNYDLMVEDIDISKFIPGKFLRGYELIKALEKENILSKEDLISFLFSNI